MVTDSLISTGESAKVPLALSKSGTNAYYCEFCPHSGNRPSYAACLNRIDAVNINETDEVDPVCTVAIQRGYCEALEMREEEVLAGKSIYFIDRKELRKESQANLARQGISFGKSNKEALTLKNKFKLDKPQVVKPKEDLGNYSLLDAINKKIEDSSSVPQSNIVDLKHENKVSANLYLNDGDSSLSNIKSGMSLAEIANSIKASKV